MVNRVASPESTGTETLKFMLARVTTEENKEGGYIKHLIE